MGTVMDLIKLFSMQKELDDYIVKTKGLEGVDLLSKRVLALQVELAELAQEWRGFKFWSEKQTPRENSKKNCRCDQGFLLVHTGEVDANGVPEAYTGEERCTHCDGSGWITYNPLLEEYIDVLHFGLSIGLEFEMEEHYYWQLVPFYEDDILNQISSLFGNAHRVYMTANDGVGQSVILLISKILGLGKMLGFSDEQIESAYTTKWNINKQRQTNGY
jgi:dimeric dUTPase (all-alpha-NTP-PPase superfamily)